MAFTPEGQAYHDEVPESEVAIQERIEGLQIARLDYIQDDLPAGWAGCALSFTSFERFIVIAMPTDPGQSPYDTRLMYRWMERPQIVTPSLAKAYRRERGRAGMYHIVGEDTPPDWIQSQIEGAVIHGWKAIREPNKFGGEQAMLELHGGRRITFNASRERDKRGRRMPIADLSLQIVQGQAPPTILAGTAAAWRQLEDVRRRAGK